MYGSEADSISDDMNPIHSKRYRKIIHLFFSGLYSIVVNKTVNKKTKEHEPKYKASHISKYKKNKNPEPDLF